MSDALVKDSKGIQAYRWWVAVGVAATTALAVWTLTTVKETAADITALKVAFSVLTTTQSHQGARLDSIERRNDQQDEKIGDLQRQVWRMTPSAPNAAEEQQRQQWRR